MIRSSWRIRTLASGAPSTAGMPRLRATIAVCDVLPPRSVMKPQKVCVARVLNWSMSAGEISCAMTIFESTGEWPLCVYAAMEAGVLPALSEAVRPPVGNPPCVHANIHSQCNRSNGRIYPAVQPIPIPRYSGARGSVWGWPPSALHRAGGGHVRSGMRSSRQAHQQGAQRAMLRVPGALDPALHGNAQSQPQSGLRKSDTG